MEFLWALHYDRALRRERVFRDPLNPLDISDEHLLRYYRFPRNVIMWLCNKLEADLKRKTKRSHALPIHTQVLVALRFYASGTFQSVLGDSVGLSQASVSKSIKLVTESFCRFARREIKMPTSAHHLIKTKQDFFAIAQFPNVIRAIDGTHVPIKAPQNEHLYINRKGTHSIKVQVICDSKNRITSFSAKFPFSTHDSFIWRNSHVRRRFETGDFGESYLLGDSGYPLEPYPMTPILDPHTQAETKYNWSHISTGAVVDQTFGILKSRFRCLHNSGGSLQYAPLKCAKIIISCLLHNYCVNNRVPLDEELHVNDDHPAENFVIQGNEANSGAPIRRHLVDNVFAETN